VLRRRSRHRHADPAGLSSIRIAVAGLALSGALLAGCGGSDNHVDLGTVSLAPSRTDYISRADGVCGLYQDRIERNGRERLGLRGGDFRVLDSGRIVFKPGRRPPDAEILGFISEIAVPELQAQLGELRALEPPAGDEAQVAAIYDSAGRATAALAADPRLALDEARMRALFTAPLRSARGYGFRVCGARPPTVPAASG
jgi:hypothetical protein